MFTLMIVTRDCGKTRTTEISYDADMRDVFHSDTAAWMQRLDDEQHGRIRGDAPICVDVLAIE